MKEIEARLSLYCEEGITEEDLDHILGACIEVGVDGQGGVALT